MLTGVGVIINLNIVFLDKPSKLFDRPNQHTAWQVSKYGIFSGPYFPVLNLNTGKYGAEKTLYLDTFDEVTLGCSIIKNLDKVSNYVGIDIMESRCSRTKERADKRLQIEQK